MIRTERAKKPLRTRRFTAPGRRQVREPLHDVIPFMREPAEIDAFGSASFPQLSCVRQGTSILRGNPCFDR